LVISRILELLDIIPPLRKPRSNGRRLIGISLDVM
jgi:hypothetical protein